MLVQTTTRSSCVWILCLLAAALALPVSFPAQGPAVDVLLQKAKALEGRGRPDLAAQTWRQVLLADSRNEEALAGLARAAKKAGNAAEARQYLDRLRAVNPRHEAITQVESISAQPVTSSRDRLETAGRLAKSQRYDDAMAVYRELYGDEPPAGKIAIAYYETLGGTPNGWESAVAGLRRFADKYPQTVDYQFALARLYTYRPKTRQDGMRLLQSIPPESPFAAQAQAAWRQAVLWDGSMPSNAPWIRAYLARFKDAEVEALVAKLPKGELAKAGPVQSPEEQAGYIALKAGKLGDAAARFEAALEATPSSPTALAGLGYVRMQEKDFAAAEDLFTKSAAAAPTNKEYAEAQKTARFWRLMTDGSRSLRNQKAEEAHASFVAALKIRPNQPQALRGLAGSLMLKREYESAAEHYEQLVTMEADNADVWRELITARREAQGAEAAVAVIQRIPPRTATQLSADPEYLALLASVYTDAGQTGDARKALERSAQLQARLKKQPTSASMLTLAGINLKQNQPLKAAELYQQVVDRDPANLVAWEGLLGALVSAGDGAKASAALRRMPAKTYEAAMQRTGFVRSAALVESASGRYDQAERLLQKIIDDAQGEPDLATRLQLANIWASKQETAKAERLMRDLAKSNPAEPEVWKALIVLLYKDDRANEALRASERIPVEARERVLNDPDYISLIASVHSATGDDEEALRLVRTAEKRLNHLQRAISPSLLLQHGWLALKTNADDREVYSALNAMPDPEQLTEDQEKNRRELWSVWTRRRAELARKAGELNRSVALLEAGWKMFPEDTALRSALAATLLEAKNSRRAMEIYKSWGMKNATPADYLSAVGAAMGVNKELASRWMQQALDKWPSNPDLLNLSGKLAAQRGDLDKAAGNWRAALSHLDTAAAKQPKDSADALASFDASSSAANWNPTSARQSLDPDNEQRLGKSVNITPKGRTTSAELSYRDAIRDEIENQLAAIESRNAPYAKTTAIVDARSGRQGFEKRVLQEAEIEGSRTIADKFRISLIARPTRIDAGSIDGGNELRFGLLPTGATLGPQTASGIAGELQLATRTFGLRAGITPSGFAVQNFVGGIRFTPGAGPFEIVLSRDPIKDTLLSYAGAKDPITGRTWGGVVANSAIARVSFGSQKSGWYASGGYQYITGQNVADNKRMDGLGGAYWRLIDSSEGRLTAGMNLFAMSYEKNLRFFTVGQGGYFSPQLYVAGSVPLTWEGKYGNRFVYSITGALGAQSFREDATSMYPTLGSLQRATGAMYPSLSVTGVSYILRASGAYQISPHWYAGFFLNLNNTRNYSSQTLNFYVQYLFQPRPLISEHQAPSIPDWKGRDPFGLQN